MESLNNDSSGCQLELPSLDADLSPKYSREEYFSRYDYILRQCGMQNVHYMMTLKK